VARSTRIYRKVETSLWTDSDYRALSKPKPNARTLWMYLLCGQRTTTIPGVVLARPAVMADDLEWPVSGWRKAMDEIAGRGMAKHDPEVGLVVLTKALLHRGTPRETSKPNSPNAMKSWVSAFRDLPDCSLKADLGVTLDAFVSACGEEMLNAFRAAMGTPCTTAPTRRDGRRVDVVRDGDASQNQDSEAEAEVGSKRAEPSAPVSSPSSNQKPDPGADIATAAIAVINSATGRSFKADNAATLKLARTLARAKYTPEQVRRVCEAKAREWVGDPKMQQFVQPSTLLAAANFAKYLDALDAGEGALRGVNGTNRVAQPPRFEDL
jgi:uncharacterized phage protein (TIGR02220 family)